MRSFCAVFAPVVLMAALAVPAEGLLIQQVEPDASLAEAQFQVFDRGDHIQVDLMKEFKDPFMMGSPLVLQFILEDGDAGKEIRLYHLVDMGGPAEEMLGEAVLNSTGLDWLDYHVLLVNVAPNSIPQLPQFADAAFSNPSGVVADYFGSPVAATEDHLDFAGGPLPSGLGMYVDGIVITHNGVPNGVFYLKQIPTPEPAVLSLLAAGALLLTRRRK
ncbi:MAG: hypothetical protein AMJ81_13350 [Phycisphaerae bacterium SM23_33]|nr:MAG: hypothetical protein AMJ81_13350 [Phycisphaerae bacterium SM23_33]